MRYENKFTIDSFFKEELIYFIRNHPYCFSKHYENRNVQNIYLDTLNFDFFRQNINGDSERKKVRIRWYGDLYNALNPKLEIKYKSGTTGTKKYFELENFSISPLSFNKNIVSILKNSTIPQYKKSKYNNLIPTCINSYKRKYYLSQNKKCRLTLDYNIRYYYPSSGLKINKEFFLSDDFLVMELKYDVKDKLFSNSFSNFFPMRIARNSKYVNAIKKFFG